MSARIAARIEPSPLPPRFAIVDRDFARQLHTKHRRTFTRTLADGESLSRELPNISLDRCEVLDDAGLITVGSTVERGTILVGAVKPRVGGTMSPEEKLLMAIFGQVTDMVDVSLRAPPGCCGEVLAVRQQARSVEVVVGWERPLEVGDVLRIGSTQAVVADIRELERDLAWNGASTAQVSKVSCARDAMRARAIGPYDSLTQQPVESADHVGGQHLSLAQVEGLAGRALWLVWELMTIKADCVWERSTTYESLIKLQNPNVLPRNGAPTPTNNVFGTFGTPQNTADAVVGLKPETIEVLAIYGQCLGVAIGFWDSEVGATALSNDEIDALTSRRVGSTATVDATGVPVPDGLRCQKTFGPIADYKCACGKYARMKHRAVVCESCGVEVISSRVRRRRFGHIELDPPCAHPLLEGASVTRLLVPPPDLRGDLDPLYARIMTADSDRRQGAVDELFAALTVQLDGLWRAALTKHVDYSGTAHLVADQTIPKGWCRVPHELLRELYRPMTYGILEAQGITSTIRAARRLVDADTAEAHAALRVASEGAHVVLATARHVIARKAIGWDHPAIGVDVDTAHRLASREVQVHLPVTYEARFECSQLTDPSAAPSPSGGWLSRAVHADSFVQCLVRAVVDGERDEVHDPLIRAALGRPPTSPAESAIRDWTQRDADRMDVLRVEVQTLAAATAPTPAAPDPRWRLPLGELGLSPATRRALENAGLSTLGDLCRRTESELLKTRGFARARLLEVKQALAAIDLTLGMRIG